MPLNILEKEGLTKEYKENLQNAEGKITKKYMYFWLLVYDDSTELFQFNKDGSENSLPKQDIQDGKIKEMWWIPKKSSWYSYGFEVTDSNRLIKDIGIWRRGRATGNMRDGWAQTFSYIFGVINDNEEEEYFVINNKGKYIKTSNPNEEVGS